MISFSTSNKSLSKSNGKKSIMRILNENNNCYFFKYFNKPLINEKYELMNHKVKLVKRKQSTEMHSQLDTKLISNPDYFKHKNIMSSLSKISTQDSQFGLFKKASFEKNILMKKMEKKQFLNYDYNKESEKGIMIENKKNQYYPIITVPNPKITSEKIVNKNENNKKKIKKISLICIDNHLSPSSREKKNHSSGIKVKTNMTETTKKVKEVNDYNDSFFKEVEELLNSVEVKICSKKIEAQGNEDENLKEEIKQEEHKIDYERINLINEARPQTSYGKILLRRSKREVKDSSSKNKIL